MHEESAVLRPGVSRRRLIGLDHFGGLLVLIIATVSLSPVLSESDVGGAISAVLAGLVLVSSFIAAGVRRQVVLATAGLAVVAVLLSVTGTLAVDGNETPAWVLGVITAMIVATPFVVLRRVLSHREVTLATLAGAICAYLLVGVAFSAVYLTIGTADPDAFSTDIQGVSTYLSFVTLATLGYGDIVPVSEVARSLAILEAVMGQLLLVTLVARFVGTLGQARQPERRLGSPTPDDDEGRH